MKKEDELKANNKCETCRDIDVCGSTSTELIAPDDIDQLSENGIEAIAIVYQCKHYKRK